jgi:hypothetical protein
VENKISADEGQGVYWEGSIIYDYLYTFKNNTRFVPVLLLGATVDCIPRPLRTHTRYEVGSFVLEDQGFEKLYRELTRQPNVTKPPLGKLVELPVLSNFPTNTSFVSEGISSKQNKDLSTVQHKTVPNVFNRFLVVALVSILCVIFFSVKEWSKSRVQNEEGKPVSAEPNRLVDAGPSTKLTPSLGSAPELVGNIWITAEKRKKFLKYAEGISKTNSLVRIFLTSEKAEARKRGNELKALLVEAKFQVNPEIGVASFVGRMGDPITLSSVAYHPQLPANSPILKCAKDTLAALGVSGILWDAEHDRDAPKNEFRIYLVEPAN